MTDFYKSRNFHKRNREKLVHIESIINEYQKAGYKLTVRQIYYQLVSRDLIPNNDREYKKIVDLVKNGRYAAILDWDMIEDRNRELKELAHWDSPNDIIETAANSYHIDLWQNQPCYCEVWVEKKALIDVVWQAASPYDVSCFACAGFNSTTAMKAAADRLKIKNEQGKHCIIFYLGDHDPSGLKMTSDIEKRLKFFGADVDIQKIALNMDQVKKYSLPPNFVKVDPDTKEYKDTRAKEYVAMYGEHSWELDALPPDILDGLISAAIKNNLDQNLFEKATERQERERQEILKLIDGLKF